MSLTFDQLCHLYQGRRVCVCVCVCVCERERERQGGGGWGWGEEGGGGGRGGEGRKRIKATEKIAYTFLAYIQGLQSYVYSNYSGAS